MTDTPGTNGITVDAALAKMDELGAINANGSESRVRASMVVLECAFHGNLDQTKNKHGDGIDDAMLLAKRYSDACVKNAVFDAKADRCRTMASKFRVLVKAAHWSKGGPGEPLATANKFLAKRLKYKKEGRKGLEDAQVGLLAMLRAQIKPGRGTVMDDAEVDTYCFKKGKEASTLEDFWIAIRKKGQQALKGKLPNCQELDDSAEAQALIALCNKRLTNIAKARGGKTTP